MPSGPNNVPDTHPHWEEPRSTPQAAVLENQPEDACRIVNVPPMSNRAGHAPTSGYVLLRKEVIQPHLPVRLPCYDLAPVTSFTLGRSLRLHTSGTPSSHGLTGGVYKARERIHRAVADARLLANPASWSRVADSNPNCEWL